MRPHLGLEEVVLPACCQLLPHEVMLDMPRDWASLTTLIDEP